MAPSAHFYAVLAGFLSLAFYSMAAGARGKKRPCLMRASQAARAAWAKSMCGREVRIMDASLIANLTNVASFFASATIVVIGALVALASTPERLDGLRALLVRLPFSDPGPASVFELKTLALSLFFIYAFFKFAWSLRQLNFCAILAGSLPQNCPAEPIHPIAAEFANLNSYASENFNQGLRCYFWALASIFWLWNPLIAPLAWLCTAAILWRREFNSKTSMSLHRAAIAAKDPDSGHS